MPQTRFTAHTMCECIRISPPGFDNYLPLSALCCERSTFVVVATLTCCCHQNTGKNDNGPSLHDFKRNSPGTTPPATTLSALSASASPKTPSTTPTSSPTTPPTRSQAATRSPSLHRVLHIFHPKGRRLCVMSWAGQILFAHYVFLVTFRNATLWQHIQRVS